MEKLTSLLTVALLVILTVVGCRREDVRTVTISVPGLCETNQTIVTSALAKYAGVRGDTIKFDLVQKTVSLKYDSMQVAQTNLRMAIESKGVKVAYPEKTDDHAGY